MSSMLSSTATVVMEDMVRPLFLWRCKRKISDKHATIINKVVAVVMGFVSIVFVLFAMNFGKSIVSVSFMF